jgi:hypothetical protein
MPPLKKLAVRHRNRSRTVKGRNSCVHAFIFFIVAASEAMRCAENPPAKPEADTRPLTCRQPRQYRAG